MCVHVRDTVRAQSGNVPAHSIHTLRLATHTSSEPSISTVLQTKGFGWVGHQNGRVERPQAAARHSSSYESRALCEWYHKGTTRYRKSVKGCPSLNSYRSGTPRIEVCASASLCRHHLGTVQAPHHRHRHPARAPLLPALSCSCKPANVRRASCVSCTSCHTATHTLYSRAHMLRTRTHSHAAHRATRM